LSSLLNDPTAQMAQFANNLYLYPEYSDILYNLYDLNLGKITRFNILQSNFKILEILGANINKMS